MYTVFTCIILAFAVQSFAYNLEGRLPLYKKGHHGSTFGFSVAMHKTTNGPGNALENNIMVVGAPTDDAASSQTNTDRPGAIYYCPLTTNVEDCSRVDMDRGGSKKSSNKSGQWLGVTVKSQGEGKFVMACAHRYSKSFGVDVNEVERLCGKCFLLNNTDDGGLREIPEKDRRGFVDSPCKRIHGAMANSFVGAGMAQAGTSLAFVNEDDYVIASPCNKTDGADMLDSKYGLGYAQAGTGLAINKDEYVLGAPGIWSWSGGMFAFNIPDLDNDESFQSSDMIQTLGCKHREQERNPSKVKCDNIPLRRDSYMGFSVTTSHNMFPNANRTMYITGAPRGNFTGAVVLYIKKTDDTGTTQLVPILYDLVLGEQIGSSFGFSVIAADINGDGLDDLIVGAPQFYQYSNKGKYGGAVYVYLRHPQRALKRVRPQRLLGPPDSFFGYSLARLGDIDQDGYEDFAVGAPYEGESGKVYIYRGSADGVNKSSQYFDGKDYRAVNGNMTAFGISLNGDIDLDNNKYPDLMVGSLSDQAILFRTRPIITVESTLKTVPAVIDVKNPNCSYGGKWYACFDVQFCFTYNSRHKEYTEKLNITYKVMLDALVHSARVHFNVPDGPTTLSDVTELPKAGLKYCPNGFHRVYFDNSVKDRLTPIKVDFEFALQSESNTINPEAPDTPMFQMINDPILDADYVKGQTSLVGIKNKCGDNGCQSDLKINGTLPPEIIVGGDGTLNMKLEVSNDGEEAHQAYVTIKLPPHVYYDNFTVVQSSGADITCFTSDKGGTTFIKCSLGNPYDSGSRDVIDIELNVSELTAETKTITIEVTGSTTSINPELSPVPLVSVVIVEMSLSLKGIGQPQQVRYVNSFIRGESDVHYTNEIGPFIEFNFNVKNEGTQRAEGVYLQVDLPYEIKNGKWLLYLVSTEVMAGGRLGGECSEDEVNVLGMKLPVSASLAASSSSRNKREAVAKPLYEAEAVSSKSSSSKFSSLVTLDCKQKTAQCVNVGCSLEALQPGETISIKLQVRLWNYTFLEEFFDVDLVHVMTSGEIKNIADNVRIVGDSKKTITTTVDHAFFQEDNAAVFPWWYILIAIIIALVIYCIIIFLLIKCGFFKRRKYLPPPENEEVEEEKPKAQEESEA